MAPLVHGRACAVDVRVAAMLLAVMASFVSGQSGPTLTAEPSGNISFTVDVGAQVGIVQRTTGAYARVATDADIATMSSTISTLQSALTVQTALVATMSSQLSTLTTTDAPTTAPTSAPSVSPNGATATNAGVSCRHIFLVRRAAGLPLVSGAYWVRNGTATSFQVYCDMTTPAQDGLSGWTLCGKYDSSMATNLTARWLTQGFGRAFVQPQDLTRMGGTSNGRVWSSIDCRLFIGPQTQWFMHAGTNDSSSAPAQSYGLATQNNGAIRFTNMLADVKADPTNLFNINRDDLGQCRARQAGGVATYNISWTNMGVRDTGVDTQCDDSSHRCGLGEGACLIGDGHSFCSFNRDGQRFSNAGCASLRQGGCGSTIPCQGSWGDTVYWAWTSDSHGCSSDLQIGTGCRQVPPSYRYNMLFVY
mmetsp:Transcript_29079/g.76172  ORF Transcript_29079/g.76172 Transcript_29079/m.76172 type:complete len:419 (+) Transcript_29079:49-1305(+)